MRVVITDSGVGGLSVCAYAERFVRMHGHAEPVQLTYANAAPANDYGYNKMPSREVKLQTFERFLATVAQRYAPDLIYVACNTLSVLLPDIAVPAKGIIETGVAQLLRELGDATAIIFGTQTTIDSGVYPRLLAARGIAPARIIAQACPGLADTIAEDVEGTAARAAIARWVATATAHATGPVVGLLACTHYGYRKAMFELPVVDPNERAVDDIFTAPGACRDVTVEIVSHYALPAATVQTLTGFLADISPATVAALQHVALF
jgi:glutamate racemase